MHMIDQIIAYNKEFVAQKGYEKYLTSKYPDKKLAVFILLTFRRYWLYSKRMLCHVASFYVSGCPQSDFGVGSWFHYTDPSVHYRVVFVFGDKADSNMWHLYGGRKYTGMYP